MTYAENVRAARKAANGGSHTEAEWQALLRRKRYRCENPFCLADLNVVGSEPDHIRPISRGGTDNIDNIQPLCPPCNRRKHARGWQEFLAAEGAAAVAKGDIYGQHGQHANDIGRAAFGQTGGYGSSTGLGGGGGNGGAWSLLQFVMGLIKGALIVPLGFLFGVLLMLAIFGGAGKRSGGDRLVEGTAGAFGLWRLWAWTWHNPSRAKTVGMIAGALLSASYLVQWNNAREAHDAALANAPKTQWEQCVDRQEKLSQAISPACDGFDSSASAPPATASAPAPLNNGPVAIHPLTMTPRFAPAWAPPAWAPPIATPHGRMGPTLTSPFPVYAGRPAPRRNIGCGWWPAGSDADRDCAARLDHPVAPNARVTQQAPAPGGLY